MLCKAYLLNDYSGTKLVPYLSITNDITVMKTFTPCASVNERSIWRNEANLLLFLF